MDTVINYEERREFVITLRAEDAAPVLPIKTATARVIITVVDVNDNDPLFLLVNKLIL